MQIFDFELQLIYIMPEEGASYHPLDKLHSAGDSTG